MKGVVLSYMEKLSELSEEKGMSITCLANYSYHFEKKKKKSGNDILQIPAVWLFVNSWKSYMNQNKKQTSQPKTCEVTCFFPNGIKSFSGFLAPQMHAVEAPSVHQL